MQIFLIKNFSNFFCDQMRGRNAKECKDRIQIYSSVALRVNAKAMQHNNYGVASYCEPTYRLE